MTDERMNAPPGVYSRRTFLRVAGATGILAATGGIVAACGGDDEAGGGSATADTVTGGTAEEVGGPFNNFTWGGYEGSGIIDDWYAENGIELNAKAITTPGGIPPTIQQGGWDASSANQGDAEYYYALGISSEITVDEVPALANLYPFFREGSFWRIEEGVYNSVPWTWGPIGITARPDRIPEGTITSYWDLTEPEYKDRLETFDDPLNMIATGAVAAGLDPGAVTREQLDGPIKDYLTQLRPNLKILATSLGDQINNLVAGDVDATLVGFTWAVVEAAKQDTEAYFLVPEKEGSFGFCDAVFIPPDAEHRANAIAYANALAEGDTALAMQQAFNQASTNPDVFEQASPEVRAIYPEDLDTYQNETLKWNKSYYDPEGEYATIEEWTALWEEVKAQG
jgi:spermidine/putrescine transport system substrate-binding protein